MAITWSSCPVSPLPWIDLREGLLVFLGEPVLVLPSLFLFTFLALWPLPLTRSSALVLSLAVSLSGSLLYSPLATSALDYWLTRQVPPITRESSPSESSTPVAVLLGRGPDIAAVTTTAAVAAYKRREIQAIYVSGDQRATADRLVALGAPSSQISGDSCARTTWENARFTANWLREQHPGSPITLITDPWQLPRATLVFRRQGLRVFPQSAIPSLSPRAHNRIAWRETLALALYRIQGRA
jgi:uncharacterized SAM-binding protein YcdF (DUF218 family)